MLAAIILTICCDYMFNQASLSQPITLGTTTVSYAWLSLQSYAETPQEWQRHHIILPTYLHFFIFLHHTGKWKLKVDGLYLLLNVVWDWK